MFKKLKAEYRASLKSMDTEEHIDLAFYRPLGFAWACLFRSIGVTPNAVTIASIFIGIGAGLCFYPTNLWINIAGILLLIWANSFDSCDGQLARLTGQYSKLGRILDGMAGDTWFITIYVAISLRMVHTEAFFEEHHWVIWTLASAAGVCHILQAAVADRYRQLHLCFVKGFKGGELDSSTEIEQQYKELTWKKDFVGKLIQALYLRYTLNQERMTPRMQEFRAMLSQRFGEEQIPSELLQQFRQLSLPLCKWENFMTFNWRSIFLFAGILAGMPWIYFVAELTVFNIVFVYTIVRHESICKKMVQAISDYKG